MEISRRISRYISRYIYVPKVTSMAEHRIQLNSSEPIRSRAYKLPYHLTEAVDKEIDELLRLGFIEPCEGTAYASLIVVVQTTEERQSEH